MENILEELNEGVVIVDDQLRVVFTNEALSRMGQYERGEIEGRTPDAIFPATDIPYIMQQHRFVQRGRRMTFAAAGQPPAMLVPTALSVFSIREAAFSIERLESEIAGLETGKYALQQQLDDLQRKINESAARDFNAELLQRTLRDFRSAIAALTAPEKSEALQCVLKSVTVHPQKLDLENI
jgi:PAS domain-containing protein